MFKDKLKPATQESETFGSYPATPGGVGDVCRLDSDVSLCRTKLWDSIYNLKSCEIVFPSTGGPAVPVGWLGYPPLGSQARWCWHDIDNADTLGHISVGSSFFLQPNDPFAYLVSGLIPVLG